MLRSVIARGVQSSLRGTPLTSSSFRPSTLSSSSSLITRSYAASPQHSTPSHPPAQHGDTHHHAADSHGSHSHGSHGSHDSHHGAADHHDHHDHDHHHVNHDNAPYGILFGEVYEGKRKIPAWEWIYYAGTIGTFIMLYFAFHDFEERRIETWARNTYDEAVAHSQRTDAKARN